MAVSFDKVILVIMACHTLAPMKSSVAIEGFVAIKFQQYKNPTGGAANGHCCDGRAFLCEKHGCDYIFQICLDDKDSINSTSGCRYGYKETRQIRNKDDVSFDRRIGDLPNPVTFSLTTSIPVLLLLKVDVYDKDEPFTEDDYVDSLQVTIFIKAGKQQFAVYGSRRKDKTSLTGYAEVICTAQCQGYEGFISTSQNPDNDNKVLFVDWPNADCDNLAQHGYRHQDGVYTLRVAHFEPFQAYCDMSERGWTIIQRRVDSHVNFFRGRSDYVKGFGEIDNNTNYWLGLEKMYWLTNQRRYKLHISLQKADSSFVYAEYESFRIDDNYVLHVGEYNGTAGDALNFRGLGGKRFHNRMPFTTYDDDNDRWPDDNCGQVYQSGWWFNDCYWANLNGIYLQANHKWPICQQGRCIAWRSIKGFENYSLIRTEMKILPV